MHLVRWTVDPLRAANAWLNIHLLGGTASTYLLDYYGAMQGIDAGAPTDRLLVDWRLDSPRVAERAARPLPDPGFHGAQALNSPVDGRPAGCPLEQAAPRLRLHLPEDFVLLARSEPALALTWRRHTRDLFQKVFAAGYAITGFTRAGGPAYIFEKR
jgi:predicted GNAT superfamily acetyltransferase